jgi:DNA-binding HxlR family transcriptional regulator
MGSSYRQFCPVAKAMELLDERWTTLLSRRLQQLVQAGVVERHEQGRDSRYVLTEAGHELRPVVEALGAWGVRWIGEIGDEDLDPKLLLWDMTGGR